MKKLNYILKVLLATILVFFFEKNENYQLFFENHTWKNKFHQHSINLPHCATPQPMGN